MRIFLGVDGTDLSATPSNTVTLYRPDGSAVVLEGTGLPGSDQGSNENPYSFLGNVTGLYVRDQKGNIIETMSGLNVGLDAFFGNKGTLVDGSYFTFDLPRASTKATILVVKPPRERPIA